MEIPPGDARDAASVHVVDSADEFPRSGSDGDQEPDARLLEGFQVAVERPPVAIDFLKQFPEGQAEAAPQEHHEELERTDVRAVHEPDFRRKRATGLTSRPFIRRPERPPVLSKVSLQATTEAHLSER